MAQTILTPIQQQILRLLSQDKPFTANFYLTGGTALSEFYLHHRFSEDLDFFSETEIDQIWLNTISTKIAKQINASKDFQNSFNRNLVFFRIDNQVIKIEFTYFPMPQINHPQMINGIPIDSELDIAVNKFFTIYQKPSARHFIDLYLLLTTKKYVWNQLKQLAQTKFDTPIDPIQLGSQLIKAQDIIDLPNMLIDLSESLWRNYFIKKAKDLKTEIVSKKP
jgi:predicted nucleotidyltransferase component of viral defense system